MLVASLGAIALGLAALAAWGWMRTPDASAEVVRFTLFLPRRLSIVPKTFVGAHIAVSPDGRVVVFAGIADDGTRRLYARGLDEAVPHALAGTEGALGPFFSPDGRWIGFVGERGLQKVAAEGGLPQTLTAMSVFEATWTNHDVIVFAADGNLYSIPGAGGSPTLVAAPDTTRGEMALGGPIALADGDHVLYWSGVPGGLEAATIGLASLSARTRKNLGIRGTNALGVLDGRLIYAARDNTLMAVPLDVSAGRATAPAVVVATDVTVTSFGSVKAALSPSGTLAYLSAERDSRIVLANGKDPVEVVLPELRAYSFPRFSPQDGKRIAVGVGAEGRSDIWVYDLASRTRTRLSSGGSVNERPEWTLDGTRVAYRTDAGPRSSIWWRPADLSGPAVSLVAGERGFWEGVFAPDGRIVVQADVNIEFRALVGDTTLKDISALPVNETQPRVSPDGRWIAFVTWGGASEQVVVQAFPGPGPRVQVSSNGGTEPVWSRDGHRLFYRANGKFMVATVADAPAFAIVSRDTLFDDTFVPAASPHANYDVSPDGKRLLVVEAVEDPQLVIVHNWGAEVRARLRARAAPK